MDTVTISKQTYANLIAAAHMAECLSKLIKEKKESYGFLSIEEINLLYTMFLLEDEE